MINGTISNRQLTVLAVIYIIGSSILIAPSGLAVQAKQDAWIAAMLGTAIGLMPIPLFSKLGKLYPDLTIVQYSEKILGKWLGKAVSLCFLSFPFLISFLVLRNIGDFITTAIMPETPIEAIHLLFLAVVVMGVRLGLEVVSRASEIFFPWTVVLFLLIAFTLLPQIDLQKVEPVLAEGIMPVVRATFPLLGTSFWQLSVFLMLFPYVKAVHKAGRAIFIGSLLGGSVLIIITVLSILVLGSDTTARHIYPTFTLAKKINIGDFLERMEAVVAGIWFLTIFFKLAICYYAVVIGFAQILKLKDYRPIVLPIAFTIIVMSIAAYPNTPFFLNFTKTAWIPYAFMCGIGIPLLLLTVAEIRKINKK